MVSHVRIEEGRNHSNEKIHVIVCTRCRSRSWHCAPWVTWAEIQMRYMDHCREHKDCK